MLPSTNTLVRTFSGPSCNISLGSVGCLQIELMVSRQVLGSLCQAQLSVRNQLLCVCVCTCALCVCVGMLL